MFHILHIYKLNMKNVSISLSTITYKRHSYCCIYTVWRSLCCSSICEMFLLDKNLFLTKEMYHVKSKLQLNISHAPSTQTVNVYLTGHIHGLRYWAKRMGSCHDSDRHVDTWTGYFLTSQINVKMFKQGSTWRFKLQCQASDIFMFLLWVRPFGM